MPYLNTQEAETKLELLSLQYPALCRLVQLTNITYEGRTSHALILRTGSRVKRPGVYLVGCLHAREWGSADLLLYLAETLLISYTNNTDVTLIGATFTADKIRSILENVELIIFPVVNPDGRTYNQESGISWRKNRAPTSQAGVLGTDINRNFNFLWDYPQYFLPGTYPASTNPQWETYYGTAPFSEAETKNVKELADLHPNIRYFVDVHSAGQLLLYPWGDDTNQTNDPLMNFRNSSYNAMRGNIDDTTYSEYMEQVDLTRYQNTSNRLKLALQQVRSKQYTPGPTSTTLYIVSGASLDYMYSRHIVDRTKRKIDTFLIEWGQAFQPAYSEMTEIIMDVSSALIELCLTAQELPLTNKTPDPLDFKTIQLGTTKTIQLRLDNLGIGAVELFNIQIQGTGFSINLTTLGPIQEGDHSFIPVTFVPPANGPATGKLIFKFRKPGVTTEDIADVQLLAAGCSVPKGSCTAPVFSPSNWFVCLLLAIAAPAVILGMLILIWIPGMLCALKRFIFRVQHCTQGNDNPCIVLIKYTLWPLSKRNN
ncbi:MAG: hypothetical protein A2Y71_10415 [Bacteroidetes bacterium RBG_13_42_15]|nr:MAG: hypothetical protein A2Y71_10415 [Bacteroidetes bacterium RBG_13_42_15]